METEFGELRAKVVEQAAVISAQTEAIDKLTAEILALKARLGMNSKNSSKPPSSGGYAKPAPKSRRGRSSNRPGKQPDAPGKNLAAVGEPDVVVRHTPGQCGRCGADLADAPRVLNQRGGWTVWLRSR